MVEESTVHIDLAGAKPLGHGQRPVGVGSPDATRKPVVGVVGDGHSVVLVGVADDRQHRTENFLPGDGHGVRHVGEHGGTHVVAVLVALGQVVGLASSAGDQSGALVNPSLDVALDAFPLGLRYQRTQPGAFGLGWAHHLGIGCCCGQLGGLVNPVSRDQEAGECRAGLAGVEVAGAHSLGNGGREVGIVKDDVGRLAAQLLVDAGDIDGRHLCNPGTGPRRAGE